MENELQGVVDRLIHAGCNYRLNELEKIYAPDLIINIVQDDQMMTFDYESNMSFFRNLKDSGAPPLSTDSKFISAQEQGELGFVIVARKLDLGAGPRHIVFNLMLRKSNQGWQVFREHAVILGEA